MTLLSTIKPSPLGCGTWTAAIFLRGGVTRLPKSPVELSIPSMSFGRVHNRTADARLTLACNNVEVRPWEHEVHLYRDRNLEAVGVPAFPTHTQSEIQMDLRDLSAWFDRRVIERDLSFQEADLAHIFLSIAEAGLERDKSPNITIDTSDTDILTTRLVSFADRRMAGEELRELVPLGLNWTVRNRTVIARGKDDLDLLPGYLLDEHLDRRSSSPLFETYSEATVLGETEEIVGTYGGVDERIGLVQVVLTGQSRIRDDISALETAQVTVETGGTEPLELNGILLPSAGYAFSDLVPGRVLDTRVTTGARKINQLMRLEELSIEVRPGTEEITVKLVSV